jgi:hypothetical protein
VLAEALNGFVGVAMISEKKGGRGRLRCRPKPYYAAFLPLDEKAAARLKQTARRRERRQQQLSTLNFNPFVV